MDVKRPNYKTSMILFYSVFPSGSDVNVTGTNDDEQLPLHSALDNSSARCVKEIIQMYPKQLHLKVSSVCLYHLKD